MQEELPEKEKRITKSTRRMSWALGVFLFLFPPSIVACLHVIVIYMDLVWIIYIPMGAFFGAFIASGIWDYFQKRERELTWLDAHLFHLNFLVVIPMVVSMIIALSALILDFQFLFGGPVDLGTLIYPYSGCSFMLVALCVAYYYLKKRDGNSRLMMFSRSMSRKNAMDVARKALDDLRLKYEFKPQISNWWGSKYLFKVYFPPLELKVWPESMTIKIFGPEGEPKRKEMENRISAILKEMNDAKAVK